jgi:predicted GIY-YIG superfamily endonuclease
MVTLMLMAQTPVGLQGGRAADPTVQVVVIELDDVVPRRTATLPNLLVTSALDPTAKLAQLRAGLGRPEWACGHAVRLREDLVGDGEPEARARARLQEAGYTVNRSTTTWRVYVLELDLPTPDGKGWLYVGETSRDVPTRIQQHLTRARNGHGRLYSEKVAAHFVRRRPDLEPDRVLLSAEQSKRAERRWAKRLRNRGYTVTSG